MIEEKKSWIKTSVLLQKEDYWAIWLGLLIVALAIVAFWGDRTLVKDFAVTPGKWSNYADIRTDFTRHVWGYLVIFLGLGTAFSLSIWIMGHSLKQYIPAFALIFFASLLIFYLAGWKVMQEFDLGAPLLALIIGLLISNIIRIPDWFKSGMRVEYYIKTGIVLLGATLPLTDIYRAGPTAFLQATIVSVCTWLTIYLAAVRIFKLDRRFGAVLGGGGAVCGVSASIAIGGAVQAEKGHISVGIAVVSVWGVIMVFVLALACKALIPPEGNVTADHPWYMISPGEAGAWVGTSEYADAAGLAVVAEIAENYEEVGEIAVRAFTLLKVIGRDIWIGIWAFILSIVAVVFWEKREQEQRINIAVVWERFPKFVLGFFIACIAISLFSTTRPTNYVGKAAVKGTYQTELKKKIPYHADFSHYQIPADLADKFKYDAANGTILFYGEMGLAELKKLSEAIRAEAYVQGTLKSKTYSADFSKYQVPPPLAQKFQYDEEKRLIAFQGEMTEKDLEILLANADEQQKIVLQQMYDFAYNQKIALKQLAFKCDWEKSEVSSRVIAPIKNLRSWAFVLCFLCIGLSTRFKDLATFGIKPFWAFTIGVLVNVPLGYFLSTVVFQHQWRFLGQ